ncbi:hypothetical protein M427DRAFT_507551, partial [Gonapodya prolifera JEL478]
AWSANGTPVQLYGDPAYGKNIHLLSPFRSARLTQAQKQHNADMSAVRISVEWSFSKIVTLFAWVDFKKNQKFLLQPVALFYSVAVLLTNCPTCLYGSPVVDLFGIAPPPLETSTWSMLRISVC